VALPKDGRRNELAPSSAEPSDAAGGDQDACRARTRSRGPGREEEGLTYITKLPKAEHEAPLLVGERGGPTMLARIGVMKALNRNKVREFNSGRKPHHWAKLK
jgi:hypothetical protein